MVLLATAETFAEDNPNGALGYFVRAVRRATQSGDKDHLARALLGAAAMLQDLGDYKSSKPYLLRVLKLGLQQAPYATIAKAMLSNNPRK